MEGGGFQATSVPSEHSAIMAQPDVIAVMVLPLSIPRESGKLNAVGGLAGEI
jgi:hypothetical protein